MGRGRLLGRGRGQKTRLDASRAQESTIAASVGGRVQVASGARPHLKGDVAAKDLLIECKRTDKASYRLQLDELLKIKLEAILANKRPAMAVQIQDKNYAVIPWDDFLELLER